MGIRHRLTNKKTLGAILLCRNLSSLLWSCPGGRRYREIRTPLCEVSSFCGGSLVSGMCGCDVKSNPKRPGHDPGMGVGTSADVQVPKSVHCVWCTVADGAVSKPLYVERRVVMARTTENLGANLLHALRVSVVGTVLYAGLVMGVVVVAVWKFPMPGV